MGGKITPTPPPLFRITAVHPKRHTKFLVGKTKLYCPDSHLSNETVRKEVTSKRDRTVTTVGREEGAVTVIEPGKGWGTGVEGEWAGSNAVGKVLFLNQGGSYKAVPLRVIHQAAHLFVVFCICGFFDNKMVFLKLKPKGKKKEKNLDSILKHRITK